ncbi:LysM peptidoglycan-binding domain-containing protein [Planctomycetota bacterium]
MTSDAKVGVLLGLVFIFIIAFLINGLPNLKSDRKNNELTTNMVSSHNSPPGLASRERQVSRDIIHRIEPTRQNPVEIWEHTRADDEVRFVTPLPVKNKESTETEEESFKTESVIKEGASSPTVKNEEAKKGDKQNRLVKVTPIKPTSPRIYLVQANDSLASISKEVYGLEEGNRIANIERIFKANTKLKSPDEIFEGQELIIPPLEDYGKIRSGPGSVLPSSIVQKVESIGKRHLSTEKKQESTENWYKVREGDNLWKIAENKLGDGNRYKEIVKLNTDILSDEDNLYVGMQLKLPG